MLTGLLSVLVAAGLMSAPLSPEQALGLRQLADLRFSPDGRRLTFTVTEPPKGATRNRDIWMLDVGSKEVRRLTWSTKTALSPRWSPDGRTLAFLSDRDGAQQIYLLSMEGGEGVRLTEGKNAVQAFEWSPDGKSMAFLAPEPPTDADEKREKEKDDARVIDRDEKHARLWVIEVGSRKVRQVTEGPWRIAEAKWLPAGDRLVVRATDQPASDREMDAIYAVQVSDGRFKEIVRPRGPFGQLSVSPDGSEIAYAGSRVDGPSPHDLYVLTLGETSARNVTGTSIDRPISAYGWRADGSLLVVGQTGFRARFYAVSRDATARPLPDLEVNPTSFALSRSGVTALVGERATIPAELWLQEGERPAEQVTRINAAFLASALVAPEVFRYKSFDGTEVEAALLKPRDLPQGQRAPLVVLIHGGPTGRWSDAFEGWGQLLVSRGYAVMYPNVRGSTGYGFKFVEANRADWGGGDYKDVMAGVDHLIKQGLADPERLGIGGWSYGGYMSAWAITQTKRFAAAVIGAGLSDLASEFGTEQGSAYDEWFFGLPYEKLDVFIKCSPITYIKNARTPSLILQGEADTTDPIGQSQQLYRGLKRYGVESEFVVYPREGHGLREEKHLLDRLSRMIAWYDKYLKKATTAP